MSTPRTPRPPATAGEAGRRLWRSVLREYSLSGADLELLRHGVILADEADALGELIARSGPLIRNTNGDPAANPACVQHRLTVIALGRTLAAIRVIADEAPGESGARTQHRSGFRGTYTGLRAVES